MGIPKGLRENLDYRTRLHEMLSNDEGAQKEFLSFCRSDLRILFDTCYWTFNPNKPPGERNFPFILRPAEAEMVNELQTAIVDRYDVIVDKSREEGATFTICGVFDGFFLLEPESMFLWGSRTEQYVDKGNELVGNNVTGSPKTIFHKTLYMLWNLPKWMRPRVGKTHCHVENLDNQSVIDGEATNEAFGAGGRYTAVGIDEMGQMEVKMASSIKDVVTDVSQCIIYNSTHSPVYGWSHPYGMLIQENKAKVIRLPWYRNPDKNKGLYKSPDLNIIEIEDLDYYKNRFPKVFRTDQRVLKASDVQTELILSYPDSKILFIADGKNNYRSMWYDKECKRRSPRNVAANLDMNPQGATETFFDLDVLGRIRSQMVRVPNVEGEIEYQINKNGKTVGVRLVKNGGRKRFRWWGKLDNNRPDQYHNYIVACDISFGTGTSNSVAGIYDVNTCEKLGMYIYSQIAPEEFCDQVVAICKWVGGASGNPHLIWEANGPGGSFDKRRRFHGYSNVFMDTKTRMNVDKRSHRPGWYSTRTSKYDLLLELRIALNEGLKREPQGKSLKIYDSDTVAELYSYIFYESGEIGPTKDAITTAGARMAHGDTVIPDGLAVLAFSHQSKSSLIPKGPLYHTTLAYAEEQVKREKIEKARTEPWLM